MTMVIGSDGVLAAEVVFDAWLLPALLLWPLVGAALVPLLARVGAGQPRSVTLGVLLLQALLGLAALLHFDPDAAGWQLSATYAWLPSLGANLSLGVDGLSLPFVVLTSWIIPLSVLGTWHEPLQRQASHGALLLLLTAGMIGVFVSRDLLLFYLSWELMLIPMYGLLGIWGSAGRSRAALVYALLTFGGSLLMLVAIAYVYVQAGSITLQLDDLRALSLTESEQLWLFAAFFLAFAIKSALVPFHTWLAPAQAAAPTIAAVLLGMKVGTYAMLRFAVPLFPLAFNHETVRAVVLAISVVAILHGAIAASAQTDMRRVLSYASISHVGLIVLGIMALTTTSVTGSAVMMINHGITTTALFLLVAMLESRGITTRLAVEQGLARRVPLLAVFLTIAVMSTIAVPGTNGFVGEWLVLLGTFERHPVTAIIAATSVVGAAVYGLYLLRMPLFGAGADRQSDGPADTAVRTMRDLDAREALVIGTFVVAMLWLGLAPQRLLRTIEPVASSLSSVVRGMPLPPTERLP
jgi:NADH-quinone oxidoreductase subunit M